MRRILVLALLVICTTAACNRPHTSRPFESLSAAMPVVEIATTVAPSPATTAHVPPKRASRSESRRAAVRPAPVGLSELLDRLASCESGGNPRAVGGGGRFFGAFQDTLTTWHAIGGRGNPVDFDYATQKALNARIPLGSWNRQFPVCSRRVGV